MTRLVDKQPNPSSGCPGHPITSQIAMMVTRRCNMACGHCSVESHPAIRRQPDEQQLLARVRDAAAAGVRSILFTGGEPMIRESVVLRLIGECKKLGLSSSMATNGFWGKTLDAARRRLTALRRAGLTSMNVSCDRYHLDFQGPEPALNIARAAEEAGFSINVSITRVARDAELEEIAARFRRLPSVRLRFYDVQPVGMARNLPAESLRAETEGFCSACNIPAVTDDGRMTACNGPAYFADPVSPLHIGSLDQSSFVDLLSRHRNDAVLDTIRTFGPTRLQEELKSIPGFEHFPFREKYHGICELCHQITDDPEAVRALGDRLSQPRFAAERVAVQHIMARNRRTGELNRERVNGAGVCRTLLRAAAQVSERWTAESHKILGRADLDWNRLADYLCDCGLSRALLPALDDAELKRWAPSFFADRIRRRATVDAAKELVARDVLRVVSEVLGALGARGVLLRDAAVLARDIASGDDGHDQSACGIDQIHVRIQPAVVAALRAELTEAGFTADQRPGRHRGLPYPPSMNHAGVSVIPHTRILPEKSPRVEKHLLADAISLEHEQLGNLQTLDAEAMVLCSAIDSTKRFFRQGLRTAWELRRIMDRSPDIDWDRLSNRVDATCTRREFWTPMAVLARELDLPIPGDFLRRAPCDRRQRKLELVARRRLFHAAASGVGQDAQLNPLSRLGVRLLVQDSFRRQVRLLAMLAVHQSRGVFRTTGRVRRFSDYRSLVLGAVRDLRQYRRATRKV